MFVLNQLLSLISILYHFSPSYVIIFHAIKDYMVSSFVHLSTLRTVVFIRDSSFEECNLSDPISLSDMLQNDLVQTMYYFVLRRIRPE